MQVEIVSEQGEATALEYSWEVKNFDESSLQLQFNFKDPERVSTSPDAFDRVRVTFWDQSLFQSTSGEAIQPGTSVEWEIFRQMDKQASANLGAVRRIQDVLLILTIALMAFLILSKGPLLPLWMFVNTL